MEAIGDYFVSSDKIAGYRPVDDKKAKLVNANKLAEEKILRMCEELRDRNAADGRWMAIAMTHFQEGFMAMNRAVMQPQRLTDADVERIRDQVGV